MRQAIVTKYLGPTNFRGSRIKASAYAGSVTIDYDASLNTEQNHMAAARKLAHKYGWKGTWYAGGLPGADGNVYVNADNAFDTDAFTLEPANG